MEFLPTSPAFLWAIAIAALGLGCMLAVAAVIHLWLRRLNRHLRESVQAALDRQRDNQQRLADGLSKLDSELHQVKRRLRALEAGDVARESPLRSDSADESGDDDAGEGDAPPRKSRRFLH